MLLQVKIGHKKKIKWAKNLYVNYFLMLMYSWNSVSSFLAVVKMWKLCKERYSENRGKSKENRWYETIFLLCKMLVVLEEKIV